MTDAERLLGRFERGEFLRPSADVPNIVDLGRAVAWLAGAEGVDRSAVSREFADLIGPSDHLVFVLADGLGMSLLETLPEGAFLSAHLARELRTIFPSTTAVALTSLATGEWPSQHGVTGWWTHLPEIGGAAALLPFVARNAGRSLTHLGITAASAFRLPSVLGRLPRDTLALFPANTVDSISSTYFSGGRDRRGYRSLADAADTIVARVAAALQPTYTYLYVPRLDVETHRHGTMHPHIRAALLDLDRHMQRMVRDLDGRARLVLTSDHGFLDTPPEARHPIRPSAELMGCLRYPPSGDARVVYFHIDAGAGERFQQGFKDRYGERFFLISLDEAVRLNLFGPGPVSAETRDRVGDFIAISGGVDVIDYVRAGGTGRVISANSHHSGLTPAEMRVPLVLA